MDNESNTTWHHEKKLLHFYKEYDQYISACTRHEKKTVVREIASIIPLNEVFEDIQKDPFAFYLDSRMNIRDMGRYSFIGSKPFLIFECKDNLCTITDPIRKRTEKGYDNPFNAISEMMSFFSWTTSKGQELPFIGGGVGFFSYDLCHYTERLPRTAVDDMDIADICICFYDGIIAVDHVEQKTYLVSLGMDQDPEAILDALEARIHNALNMHMHIHKTISAGDQACSKEYTTTGKQEYATSNFTKDAYMQAVDKIKNYIRNGDIYQANLTQRFMFKTEEEPFEIYKRLQTINPAPYGAFIKFNDLFILSSSPERFLKISDKKIETRPIKGTRPRGKTPKEDAYYQQELLSSEKDRAELLMIVDLERNDLGRVAKMGSVKVEELFTLEAYPTVFHLVSTVTGEIREDFDEIDCIREAFPGGSITGAPKIRAMEIIDELEPTQRNIYTGAIGYLGFDGQVDLNIVIRTIVIKHDVAYFQAGGGIVWDSEPQKEYEETYHKARALFRALGAKEPMMSDGSL